MKSFFTSAHCEARVHCLACRIDKGWRESLRKAGLVEAADFDCPHGITAETAPAIQSEALAKLPGAKEQTEVAARRKAEMEAEGRAAWAWLHTNAANDSLTTERLAGVFLPIIPAYGCGCRREWQEILAKNPLPPTGQAQWAQDRHNDVNRKLGKPLWPY